MWSSKAMTLSYYHLECVPDIRKTGWVIVILCLRLLRCGGRLEWHWPQKLIGCKSTQWLLFLECHLVLSAGSRDVLLTACASIHRNWCAYVVPRNVSCVVLGSTESFQEPVMAPCPAYQPDCQQQVTWANMGARKGWGGGGGVVEGLLDEPGTFGC